MPNDVNALSDTEMLDFFEKNQQCFLNLGKHWYVRKAWNMPFKKRNSLREAITLAVQMNAQESPATANPIIPANLCKEVILQQ